VVVPGCVSRRVAAPSESQPVIYCASYCAVTVDGRAGKVIIDVEHCSILCRKHCLLLPVVHGATCIPSSGATLMSGDLAGGDESVEPHSACVLFVMMIYCSCDSVYLSCTSTDATDDFEC